MVKRRSSVLRATVAVLVVGVALLILTQGQSGPSTVSPCARPAAPAPSVSEAAQRKASRVALRMPFVRRLLAGESSGGGGVSVGGQGTRKGTLIGVQVEIRLGHPAAVSATWPWILVDNTDTLHPPYQIIRQRVRSQRVWAVTIIVLAPSYRIGAVSNWVTAPGSSVDPVPGSHDQRPPQPNCD